MKEKEWKIEYDIPELPSGLMSAGYTPLLAYVLASRGITSAEQADSFIHGSEILYDPGMLLGMDDAVTRIRRASEQGETIAVYGDYDVDGITSTCLLVDYFRSRGISCIPYIPDRSEEGYGLNCDALNLLKNEKGVSLVITVDCGITAVAETEYASSIGLDIIITDHHECKDSALPEACAVVDCKRPGDPYPNPDLAGVGVAFKLACACEGDSHAVLDRYADLVATGTVADVMLLTGENRYLVKEGIKQLKRCPRPGMSAMFQESGLDSAHITASSIGFVLAPRLNAAGRLGNAIDAAMLLLTSDPQEAAKRAADLCELNRKRQEIENTIWKEANSILGRKEITGPIVLASGEWHQGVIGIAASRLAEQYSVPAIMIHMDGDEGKGSCRSYGGFNLYDALSNCSDYLISFGGHSLAAGLNIRKDKLEDFSRAFTAYYSDNPPGPQCEVVCDLLITDPSLLSIENVKDLDLLEPYGNGNQKPVMCMTGLHVDAYSNVGNGKHLKLRLSVGDAFFDAIFFSHNSSEFHLQAGDFVDIAFSPQINDFHGNRSVQFVLSALRRHTADSAGELCADILEDNCSYEKAASQFCPERADFVRVWKSLGRNFRLGKDLSSLLSDCPSGMTPEMFCICLSVFREAGLLACSGKSVYGATAETPAEKADLETTPLLRRLRAARLNK